MPTFFKGNGDGQIGRTVGCPDPHTEGTVAMLELDPRISWDSHTSIITRVTLSQQGNFQFLHTIGNDIYVYVFGDRIGQVTISGLSMTKDCKGGGGKHGFAKIMEWYKDNRIAMRKEPITITIGQAPAIEGFVTGLTGDAVSPETLLIQFGLQIAVLPEKR